MEIWELLIEVHVLSTQFKLHFSGDYSVTKEMFYLWGLDDVFFPCENLTYLVEIFFAVL